ncbi:MAG: thioredoxin family protein [Nitrososphaerales archaeon]
MTNGRVLDVRAGNWEKEALKSDTLAVVEFWHEECVWCKRLEPLYRELSEEYMGKVKFARLNIYENHENQHIAMKYGIMGTPTLVFFCDGRPIQQVVGFRPKKALKEIIDHVLEEYRKCIEQSTALPR